MAETKTKPTNGHATAEDVAQTTPIQYVLPPAMARRIMDRQSAIDTAIAARDDDIELARALAGASASARIQQTPSGGLMFVEPKE